MRALECVKETRESRANQNKTLNNLREMSHIQEALLSLINYLYATVKFDENLLRLHLRVILLKSLESYEGAYVLRNERG